MSSTRMIIAVVTPVFNDWTQLSKLICALEAVNLSESIKFNLLVIDDGSSEPATIDCPAGSLRRISDIEIIGLACNLGHQRAIAIGLVEASRRKIYDFVIVMDSDGEDRPSDIPRLIEEATLHSDHIICVQRKRRPGLFAFYVWYELYKLVFRVLTGLQIDFGNFCVIPRARLESLIRTPSVWNNLAASLTRSRIPLATIPLDRGKRFGGKSRMNFVSLVVHGLTAMAVYSDVIMVRLMIGTLVLTAITFSGILTVFAIRFWSNLAIPGWASSVAGLLTIILLQGVILFAISAFNILYTRNMKAVIPVEDADAFVISRHFITSHFDK